MNEEINDLYKSFSQHKFDVLPSDLPEVIVGSLQNIAAMKAMQIFMLKYLSEITGKKAGELDKELKSIFASHLADEFSRFFSKRSQG
jgi:hypothetical protein